MHGLILAKDQNYREAEIFLKAVTDFYPRFVEGWIILHLLYICMDYCPGIDLTLRIAEKCMKDDDSETEISNEDFLAWTMDSLSTEQRVHDNGHASNEIIFLRFCWHSAYGRNVLLKQIRSCAILFGRAALFVITPIRGCFVAFKRSRMYLRIGLFDKRLNGALLLSKVQFCGSYSLL